jgi:O-succinylbenzoic acid--CoA ligase
MTFLIKTAAQKHPDQLAFDDGENQIKYSDLEDLLAKSQFSNLGLQSGEHVAWCPRNDFESLQFFWALQRIGCVACPISHRFPAEIRAEIVERIDAKWLPALVDSLKSSFAPRENATFMAPKATIILSSGSTGIPKAIVHSMAAHVANAEGVATNMPLGSGDRWLWSLPLCHVSGLSILVRCAVAGATVVGMSADTQLSASLLDDKCITHLSVVTTQLRRLLAEDLFPSPHLKAVLLGGSSVDEQMVIEARQRGVPVHTTYGLTEMGSQVTTSTPTCDPTTSGRILQRREMKLEADGEILVRGEPLCLGYYREGKIHPVVDEHGWFHTKDLGTIDADGRLTVKGRIDNMFVSGGENVHPESIERAMLSQFKIDQVVVVPKPDAEFGFRPAAFIEGQLPSDWDRQLRQLLQGYEIPVEIIKWPAGVEGTIKPNRKRLQELV